MSPRDPNVLVVGAGVGGLACAIDLAAQGARVRILEKEPVAGGKARVQRVGGREIDAGPTVLTMAWVFDELFEAAGRTFRSDVPLERAEVLARHAWRDGTRLDLYDDRDRSADAIGQALGARQAQAYRDFCEETRRIYEIAEQPFLRGQRLTLGSIVTRFGALGLAALAKLDSHRSMWRALEQRFSEPKLRQLFGRYATYCGSSPFEAPATLNLIAHVEADGVYRAAGGIRGLVVGLERLARSLGVLIHYDTPVERIVLERGRARGALTQEGFFEADAVVFNGDVSALGRGLLGEAAARGGAVTPRSTRSLSAVTWTMTGRPDGIPLLHHNVFFPDDYRAEFDAIFRQQKVPGAPTVYICAQDRAGSDSAELDSAELGSPHSSGTEDERFLIIVNAPPTGDEPGHWSESERQRCTEAMEGLLEATGVALSASARSQTTPADFHRLFPGTGGALYGPRSKGARSVLSRVGAATKVPGLYLTGGSVHPGAGMPMATLSGRLAAERIREDLMAGLVSIGGSLRAATTGTTSTE